MKVSTITSIVLLGAVLAADQGGSLALFVTSVDYVSPTYAPDPVLPATRLLFTGEPLLLNVDIRNQGGVTARLMTNESPGLRVHVRQDGQVIDLPTAVSKTPGRVFRSTVVPDEWRSSMSLQPTESIRWAVHTGVEALRPGTYEIDIEVVGVDERGNGVNPRVPQQIVEIRERTPESSQEILARTTTRLFYGKHYLEAEEAAQMMIREFPNSVVGLSLLGRIVAAQGRTTEAVTHLEAALAVLRRSADKSLLLFRASSITEVTANLALEIERLRQN